ncbi:MAG: hypothetical protein ACLP7P_11055 [Rhodomicrobium sp.]
MIRTVIAAAAALAIISAAPISTVANAGGGGSSAVKRTSTVANASPRTHLAGKAKTGLTEFSSSSARSRRSNH